MTNSAHGPALVPAARGVGVGTLLVHFQHQTADETHGPVPQAEQRGGTAKCSADVMQRDSVAFLHKAFLHRAWVAIHLKSHSWSLGHHGEALFHPLSGQGKPAG